MTKRGQIGSLIYKLSAELSSEMVPTGDRWTSISDTVEADVLELRASRRRERHNADHSAPSPGSCSGGQRAIITGPTVSGSCHPAAAPAPHSLHTTTTSLCQSLVPSSPPCLTRPSASPSPIPLTAAWSGGTSPALACTCLPGDSVRPQRVRVEHDDGDGDVVPEEAHHLLRQGEKLRDPTVVQAVLSPAQRVA